MGLQVGEHDSCIMWLSNVHQFSLRNISTHSESRQSTVEQYTKFHRIDKKIFLFLHRSVAANIGKTIIPIIHCIILKLHEILVM
jgi:hypothetical protein